MSETKRARKKICIVTPEFPPHQWGGLARTVERVARHVRDMGLDVHVANFTIDPDSLVLLDENRKTTEIDGIRIHRLTVGREKMPDNAREMWDCPHTLTVQMMYQSLEMLHRDEHFELFHSFFLYPVGYVTGLLAKRFHVPCLTTVVGNDVKKYIFSPEKAAVCKSGLENADRIVALSRDLVEMADALTPIVGKARIIFNSATIPEHSWKLSPRHGTPFRIGCAGIFKYAKGLPYLLKALSMLKPRHEFVLELAGELRSEERLVYEQMLSRTGLVDHLVRRDPIPHDKIPEWLRTLDTFVLPSLTEGCPNILMEALAAGVPSVATRTGANEELVEDHVSGLLVPWGDSIALSTAIQDLMNDASLRQALGAAARTKMELLSPEKERKEWENVYRELIDF
jgi:L-malate glycosyltransferase